MAEAAARRLGPGGGESLRALFDAGGGPHAPAKLFESFGRPEFKVDGVTTGTLDIEGARATMPVQARLKWKNQGITRAIRVNSRDRTAQLEAQLQVQGGEWRVTGLRLAAPFDP
jgi:hypothetical protein